MNFLLIENVGSENNKQCDDLPLEWTQEELSTKFGLLLMVDAIPKMANRIVIQLLYAEHVGQYEKFCRKQKSSAGGTWPRKKNKFQKMQTGNTERNEKSGTWLNRNPF